MKKEIETSLFVNEKTDCFKENIIEVLWSIQAQLKSISDNYEKQTKLMSEAYSKINKK